MVLVIEHQVRLVFIRVDELIKSPRNRTRRHVGEHEAADLVGTVGDLTPTQVIVMRQPVHGSNHGGGCLTTPKPPAGGHTPLKSPRCGHPPRPASPPLLP